MRVTPTQESLTSLRQALDDLENSKGSVAGAVHKILRAARTVGDDEIRIWCEIQLGNPQYTLPLKKFVEDLLAAHKNSQNKEAAASVEKSREVVIKAGINLESHLTIEELNVKSNDSGGAYTNIGFVEERYADLVRTKRGNDSTYYKSNLNQHINYVRRAAHERATALYNRLAYSDSPQTTIDLMRAEVDDKLLDLAPELAEKLMVAFKSVVSDRPEEWSHALTTCRRFVEQLADVLHPATGDVTRNGRALGKAQYINRIWAYMDAAIESETNRDLAKSHIDFLGSYLQKLHKQSNKGVHAELTKIEAIKAVLHTYLIVADLLGYLDKSKLAKSTVQNIHTASLDEIESTLGVSRSIAKEIIKLRVQHGAITTELLASIKGVGVKT
jgi:DNA uptake protein ComE-like DNA-binding protein